MGKQPPTPDEADSAPARERIAKRLARAGLCSRRDAETWVLAGRIAVNGAVIDTPATTVGEGDRIEVDGKPLPARERTRLWLYHKPAGLVTTARDPEGRATVFSALPADMPRVLSIGRLDINTEGLLLLTNDGGLARILELPETGWLRRYRVRAHGEITQAQLDPLKDGIAVDGILYGPIEAVMDRAQGANVWLTLALREGKNREVKKVLGALGLTVNRLIRLSFGPFQLGDLPEGEVREIKGRMLRDQLGPRLIEAAGADFDSPVANRQQAAADDTVEPRKREGRAAAKWKPRAAGQAGEGELERLDTRRPARPRNKPADGPARGPARARTDRATGKRSGEARPSENRLSEKRSSEKRSPENRPPDSRPSGHRSVGKPAGRPFSKAQSGPAGEDAPRRGKAPGGASTNTPRQPSAGRNGKPGGKFGKGRDGAPGDRAKGKGSDKGNDRGRDRGHDRGRGNDGPGKGGRPPSGRGGPNADRRR